MKFVINSSVIKECGNGTDEYLFSYKDYTIKSISSIIIDEKTHGMAKAEYFSSMGLIPFVDISNEEILRSFIDEQGSTKLKDILNKVDSKDFVDTFWKYFNAYPELQKNTLIKFSDRYILNKIVAWCNDNNIEYEISL